MAAAEAAARPARSSASFPVSSPVSCPAIVVAAPASGQGKTTVAAALARLHVRQGRRVCVFKCGPDFLDPHWLQLASAAPVQQLDLWMTGEADCQQRLFDAASPDGQAADLIIVEGVMGLFDGKPSVGDLAQRFGIPVLAVVDASAMAGTFGAIAHGLRHYRPTLPWAGVLANRVAGARHADMLREGLSDADDWLGAMPRVSLQTPGNAAPKGLLPERHLGLVAAHELADGLQRLDAAADALASTPLGQMSLQDLQRWAVCFPAPAATAALAKPLLAGRTIAVARDVAFCFIYAANLQTLEQLGARLVFFSPLADVCLPACDAVWLTGGYPELHTEQIGANQGMAESLRAHLAQGRPVWAECGGMMALFESITLADGQQRALWGLLPGRVTMQRRLAALGPQQLTLDGDVDGAVLRGHTFHYSTTSSSAAVVARTARPERPGLEAKADAGEAVYQQGALRASYFHAWFASNPVATARLFGGDAA
ncbi:cobyrinate a,c-diamide synthase [Variovorax sp. HJSM1_2]|uniref:cobyrinate a,c-diamide synthase n=1 Tax=Variovorax sp. HJSM1_2 TaxID=3366263 RepID=UPI003BCB462E